MKSFPNRAIPDRPDLLLDGGTKIAPAYTRALQRWRMKMSEVFSIEANEHADWPPEDPIQCFRNFSKRPTLAREMALELSAILLEMEQDEDRYGTKMLHPHQKYQVAWTIMELLESGDSYLIEGAPGTGKTILLGLIMMAATRLQIRGILKGNIAYGTHRPFILPQQVFSPEHRGRRLAEAPTTTDLNFEWEYVEKILGKDRAASIGKHAWKALRKATFDNPSVAQQGLCELLNKTGAQAALSTLQRSDQAITALMDLLLGNSMLVWDTDETPMAIRGGTLISQGEAETMSYSGDLGRGIPPEYVARGWVLARKGVALDGNVLEKGADHSGDARVLLTTTPSILYRNFRSSLIKFFKRTEIVIVDDGRNAATAFQDAVAEAKGSQKNPPLVFMASALGTTNGIGSRPHADRNSIRITMEEAMNQRVLPHVGVDIFPGGDAPIYPSGTGEAIDQLVAAHFADLELPQDINQPQPRDCSTVMVVDAHSIDAVVKRFRAEYSSRVLPATVIGFRVNHERRTDVGNTVTPYSERVFNWMLNALPDANGKMPVRILVSAPKDVSDALSLTNLQNITIGTGKGVGQNMLLRIFGRLQHSNLHRDGGKTYRGYFRQGLYQETDPRETLFHLLKHTVPMEGKDTLAWVPLQILHGGSAAKYDEERVIGKKKTMMPLTRKAFEGRKRQDGTRILTMRTLPAPNLNGSLQQHIERLESHDAWIDLAVTAAQMQWSDRQTFATHIIEIVFTFAPQFMVKNRACWECAFRERMTLALDFVGMIEAVKERLISGVRLGRAADFLDEISLPDPVLLAENGHEEDPQPETTDFADTEGSLDPDEDKEPTTDQIMALEEVDAKELEYENLLDDKFSIARLLRAE